MFFVKDFVYKKDVNIVVRKELMNLIADNVRVPKTKRNDKKRRLMGTS